MGVTSTSDWEVFVAVERMKGCTVFATVGFCCDKSINLDRNQTKL